MENSIDTEKINIDATDELIDVIRRIQESKADRLLLTFAEASDLLISPINFKVLQDTADEIGKVIIAQIVQDKAGIINAGIAGVVTSDQPGVIGESLWKDSELQKKDRLRETHTKLRKHKEDRTETGNDFATVQELDEDKITQQNQKLKTETEDTEHIETNRNINLEIEQSDVSKETLANAITEEIEVKPQIAELAKPEEETQRENPATTAEIRRRGFQDRINTALTKSKEEISSGRMKLVTDGDFVMAMDADISTIMEHKEIPNRTINADSSMKKTNEGNLDSKKDTDNLPDNFVGKDFYTPSFKTVNMSRSSLQDDTAPIKKNLPLKEEKGLKEQSLGKKLFINVGLKLVLPLLIILGISAYFAYTFLPLVKVKVFIESKDVATEKTFTGQPGSVFSKELGTMAVKVEEIKKERADSGVATGVSYRGERAVGSITITCKLTASGAILTVPADTTFTSANNLTYKLNSAVSIPCEGGSGTKPGVLTATNIGTEYNTPTSPFTLSSNSITEAEGVGSGSFTGGSKSQYKSVSAEDIQKTTDNLKNLTFTEATNELKSMKAGDGWVIVESTIVNELDGTPKSDVPAGTETDVYNVTLKTKSRALYYKKTELEAVKQDLIMDEAKQRNLFQASSSTAIKPMQDIKSTYTLVGVANDIITLNFKVEGQVKPDVNRDELTKALLGKSWSDGGKLLSELTYTAKPTEYSFSPDWFPKWLRYFPNNINKVIVTVEEIKIATQPVDSNATSTATTTTPTQ